MEKTGEGQEREGGKGGQGRREGGKEGEELGEVSEPFRWCMGKFGEGSSRGHGAAETPGYCKQMDRGKGGDGPPSLPLPPLSRAASLYVIALALLDSSEACKACCARPALALPGTPIPSHSQAELEKGCWGKGHSGSYSGAAKLTRDDLREGSRQGKGCASARTKDMKQTGRQTDRQADHICGGVQSFSVPPSPVPLPRGLRKSCPGFWLSPPHLRSDLKLSA